MRIVHNDEVCEVSADDFWSLRMDTGFDHFIAEGDKQIWSLLSEAEEPAAKLGHRQKLGAIFGSFFFLDRIRLGSNAGGMK